MYSYALLMTPLLSQFEMGRHRSWRFDAMRVFTIRRPRGRVE
jgi:hypothetical protein